MRRVDPTRFETAVALALTLAAVALHVLTFLHRGALWRDEANAVEMGRMTLRAAWAHLPFDSLLMGPIAVYHGMAMAGLAADDTAFRALGLAFGIAILALLWCAGLRLLGRPPLIALVLFGLSPVGVRYGDSLRAYGLAIATLLAAYLSGALAARQPSARRVALASLAAAAAVQCSYLNSVLIAALCAGGVAVALRSGDRRRAVIALVPGVAGAASLSVYLERMRATWAVLDVQVRPVSWAETLEQFAAAIATPSSPAIATCWLMAAVAAVVAAAYRFGGRLAEDESSRSSAVFASAALATALPLYLFFVKQAGVNPLPWHFSPLLAFSALSLDAMIGIGAGGASRARAVRALLVALAAVAVFPTAADFVRLRHTNVDRVAAILEDLTVEGDLVVVSPYHLGVSFGRYYRGAAQWVTLPPVDDHRVHRFDLLRAAMASENPLEPVLDRADETLRAGHRVFAVTDIPIFRNRPSRPETPHVPDPDWGWNASGHLIVWSLQFGHFLQTHAARGESIPVPEDDDVSPHERLLLIEAEGVIALPATSGAPSSNRAGSR